MKFYKHILNFLTNTKSNGATFKRLLKLPLILLSGVVVLYSAIKRNIYGNGTDSGIFTISFGNINMGGSGKTPFTAELSEYLYEKGLKPCIVSRGYKGSLKKKSI